jgi:hypothetical protein
MLCQSNKFISCHVKTYLLFLEENLSGDLYDVAEEIADVADELRDDDNVGELHRGGSFDDSE